MLARRDWIKLSCICRVKIVSASIGSQGMPARWEHVYRPLEYLLSKYNFVTSSV